MNPVRQHKSVLSVLVLLLLFIATSAHAEISIQSVANDWALTISEADLVGGAGSELNGAYDNSASQGFLGVAGTAGSGDTWRVDVRRTDIVWDSHLTLSVQRTSAGDGPGLCSGGDTLQPIGLTDSLFFTGMGDDSNIRILLEISGMSLQVPPDTYSTTITYTVVDT